MSTTLEVQPGLDELECRRARKIENIVEIALRCNSDSKSDAVAWLERDWERQRREREEIRAKHLKRYGPEVRLPMLNTPKMNRLRKAIDKLTSSGVRA